MAGRAVVTKANRQARFEYGMTRVMLWAKFQTLGGRLDNSQLEKFIKLLEEAVNG